MVKYILVCLSVALIGLQAAKLPQYLTKCKKSDPQLNDCLKTTAQAAWKTLVKGDSASHFQSLNPFKIPHFHVTVHENLQGNLTDVIVTGLADITFNEIKMDLIKKTIDIKFSTPRLVFKGNYQVIGKLLGTVPIQGEGPANVTLDNMGNDLHMDYEIKTRGNKEYIKIGTNRMQYTTSRAYFILGNLFGGDQRLAKDVQQVLDESWEAVNEEVRGRFGDAIGAAYSGVLQSFFRRIPINDLFAE